MDLTWPAKELLATLPPTNNSWAGLIMRHYLNRYVKKLLYGGETAANRVRCGGSNLVWAFIFVVSCPRA